MCCKFQKRQESDWLGRPNSVLCSHFEQMVDELNLLPNIRKRPVNTVLNAEFGHGGVRRKAPSPSCRNRRFAIHADRLRPRLKGGWLPVAGPAARRPAGRRHRRPSQPLRRLRFRSTRRPPGFDSCLRALREADVLVVWKLDLVEHPEGALCLGVWRWIAPHNLTPRFVAASFNGVDSPTGRDTTGQPSLVA